MEKDAGEKTIAWLDKIRNSNGSILTSQIRLNMQRVMQSNAAVFRTQETLEEGTFCKFQFPIFTVFLLLFHRVTILHQLDVRTYNSIHKTDCVFLVEIFTWVGNQYYC